jgi:phosphatidate cytidylyltransferase
VFVTRLATSAIGIPLVVLTIWVGGELLAAVLAVAVFIAVLEVAVIRNVQRTLAGLLPAALAAALPPAALAGIDWLLGAVVLLIVALGSVFAWTGNPRAGLEDWLWGVALGLYVGVLASHAALLRDAPDGRDWLFFSVLVVWITDTGAYAVGRAIGRHKLAPVVSPGKTIEGAIGSFVTGFVAVLALSELFGLDVGLADQVALGFLLPPIILVGDLAESAIKRALDVKDSGFLVPGHGGVLDRLDSLLFAIPVVYYYLELVVQ